jgi:alpha-tubulin suppressor-like RCC1 family protein
MAAGRYHTAAIKTDGTLWAWGENGSGQLGINATTNRSSPVQVGALTNWSQVSAGDQTLAITRG